MKKFAFFPILFLIFLCISSCSKTKYQLTKSTDSNGYSYETVTNDPMGVRIYTLK